jgi:hypothetical protein
LRGPKKIKAMKKITISSGIPMEPINLLKPAFSGEA